MPNKIIYKRVGIAFFITLTSMIIAGFYGDYAKSSGIMSKYLAQALVFFVLVIVCFSYIRIKVDKKNPKKIGLNSVGKSFLFFLLGLSFFLIPLILTLLLVVYNDWATVSFNLIENKTLLIGILTVFLFEAFPEEFVFRGYIFSNLNVAFSKWKAALITIVLFVLFPVCTFFIASNLLGIEGNIGGEESISISYIITLLFFGCFVLYLRILTKSIWTSIGFHLLFVYINQLIGIDSNSFVQLTDIVDESLIQKTLIGFMAAIFIVIIIYPFIIKNKIRWKAKNIET